MKRWFFLIIIAGFMGFFAWKAITVSDWSVRFFAAGAIWNLAFALFLSEDQMGGWSLGPALVVPFMLALTVLMVNLLGGILPIVGPIMVLVVAEVAWFVFSLYLVSWEIDVRNRLSLANRQYLADHQTPLRMTWAFMHDNRRLRTIWRLGYILGVVYWGAVVVFQYHNMTYWSLLAYCLCLPLIFRYYRAGHFESKEAISTTSAA